MIEFSNWKLTGKWFFTRRFISLNETRFPGLFIGWSKGWRGVRVAIDKEHIYRWGAMK